MDVLNKFLQAEINSKEYYESIINFINLTCYDYTVHGSLKWQGKEKKG